MGQYYIAILLADKGTTKKEFIRLYVRPHAYGQGAKLMEHSYCGNDIMNVIESLISQTGMFYKSRLVWAGDYAKEEEGSESDAYADAYAEEASNLYRQTSNDENVDKSFRYTVKNPQYYRYIVNHTKKTYVDKEHRNSEKDEEREPDYKIHPLPLLTSEGNGSGGGDYSGNNEHLCGTWARDTVSMETTIPEGYTELVCDFEEY